MSNQTCIPIPKGGNPIVWHMDVGDRLQLKNLKYGGNQQVYVTCGPQVADVCGKISLPNVSLIQDGEKSEVTMKGKLSVGARMPVPHSEDHNTIYKNIDLVCK